MNGNFAETLRKLREEKGITQKQLGKEMFVNHSTIARWESGTRLPDAAMILRLARSLGVDANILFQIVGRSEDIPNVLVVDDSRVILTENLSVLEEAMPDAAITGYIWPGEAVEYAKMNRISLAFLDIELGASSGFDLCRKLLEVNPLTNIVFLTAYADYAINAWGTMACGFLLKPLTVEAVKDQLKRLRYPLSTGGADK
ncbi:MAG: helix-turn-helix domain-containing protein [Clostridia bacterium]|nr:helix-turn-helix domain-containing protein [Clostridia bacterium]